MDGIGRAENTILIQDTKLGRDTLDEYVLKADAIPTSLFEGRTVETLLRDPVNDLLIGATTDSDQTGIFFDPKLQRRYDAAKKAFVGYHVILESYSENLSKIAIETDGVDDAGTHWLVDMITGKADELTVDYPGITSADVGPTRMFSYRADDGLDLEGLLTLPPRTHRPNLPLVVIVNDGPIGECVRPGFYYHAQAFASRGYAVFQPNYRGSCGYGAAFRERGMGEWGRKILTDISGGVEALAKTGLVDRDRVCIVGSGYGGYAALAGVTVQKGLYKCAVSRGGISDVGIWMARKVQGRDAGANRYYQQLLGVKFAGDKALERISPARQAANADAPIMLIHGKDDSQVPYAQSLNMSLALKAAHKPFEFVSLEDEDHWMSREATRVQALEAYLAFVQKYNPVELLSAADR